MGPSESELAQPIRRLSHRRRIVRWLWRNLNFYRVHLLGFILTPFLASIIFYLSNGQYHIPYVDCLFLCVTSMCVNGLATVNLSTLTGFQQSIMFVLMWIGHPVTISIMIIQSRMWIFEDHLEPLVRKRQEEREARRRNMGNGRWPKRILTAFTSTVQSSNNQQHVQTAESADVDADAELSRKGRLRVSMIRRMSNAPQRVNPSGHIMELRPVEPPVPMLEQNGRDTSGAVFQESPRSFRADLPADPPSIEVRQATNEDPNMTTATTFGNERDSTSVRLNARRGTREGHDMFSLSDERGTSTAIPDTQTIPRTQTIEFALPRPPRIGSPERARSDFPTHQSADGKRPTAFTDDSGLQRRGHYGLERHASHVNPLPRTITGASTKRRGSIHTGFGGFPTPYRLLIRFVSWVAPATAERVRMRLTVPRTQSLKLKPTMSIASQTIEAALRSERKMISEDLEFLGGVEYKALKLLRLIVILYHIGIQLFGFALIAGDALRPKWIPVFEAQHRYVPPAWFAAFQVVSAYTNTGTSLSDQSMVPFQTARLMIITMFVLILAGNTAFPIFLRLIIYILKKCNKTEAPIQAPLHFLLKHPRRCYIYLFPSHQTWFLLTMIVTLTVTDWVCFLVLDIGNPVTESIPTGTRVLIGLLQASAVRAAGFSTISLAALAPAVKVLYVIMMYVSIYPIAMSVRSTNVYEEKSLGVFEEDANGSESSSLLSQEQRFGEREGESRRKVWGEYLLWHARQQLAFDMWWLGLALWLICVIERGPLMDPNNQSWFNIFTVVFEVVSAYGTVGMSLGVAYDNFSTAGGFTTLSKLVIIAVMIRGRHRGLPVAIDRAIVLPSEYNKSTEKFNREPLPTRSQPASEDPTNRGFNGAQDPISSFSTHSPDFREPEQNTQHLGTQLEAVPESSPGSPSLKSSHSISRPVSTLSFLSSAESRK